MGLTCWLAFGVAGQGRAQDACVAEGDEPTDLRLTPAVNSPEPITLDAPVIVRFGAGTDVSDVDPEPLLSLRRVDEDGTRIGVEGRYERFAAQPNVLVFLPEVALLPESDYTGNVTDPSGFTQRELSFSTGTRHDELEPRFGRRAPRLGARRSASDCGGVRVDVAFLPADDDGPGGSLEHLVFQTRGRGLRAPVLRKRVRATMDSEVSASFLLSEAQAAEPICVQVLAVDGVGRVSEPRNEVCFTPSPGAQFVGLCALGHRGTPGLAAAMVLTTVALGWRRCRKA